MYGQDFEFAVFVIVGWVAFLLVAAIVEWFITLNGTSPRTYNGRY